MLRRLILCVNLFAGLRSGCEPLDALLVGWAYEEAIHEDSGGVDLVGVEVADFDDFFDFGDADLPGSCHHGVEIACGFAELEVAPAVSAPGLNDAEIGF